MKLKWVNDEDEVENERERGKIKQVFQKSEVNQLRIVVDVEKGVGENETNVLLIMSKDRTDQEWN